MSSVKWLNKLLFLEAFLGIYRNYCTHKNTTKCLILLQIFIQSLLRLIVVIINLSLLGDVGVNNAFKFLGAAADLVTIAMVVCSIYHSQTFMGYYYNICRVSQYFKVDKQIFRTIKRVFGSCICFTILLVGYTIYKSYEKIRLVILDSTLIWAIVITSEAATSITLIFHQLLLYVVIMILVVLTKCLTSLISMIRIDFEGDESSEICITRDQIQDWVDIYRDLTDSCEKLTLCFGRPFMFSLILSMFQYVVTSYWVFAITILDKGEIKMSTEECVTTILILLVSVFVMTTPLFAGQQVSNEGTNLRRELAGLYNVMVVDSEEAEAKLVKDFICVIKKNSLQIKLLSKSAGMYMLPVILSIAVNYLIVMLQFNHVI